MGSFGLTGSMLAMLFFEPVCSKELPHRCHKVNDGTCFLFPQNILFEFCSFCWKTLTCFTLEHKMFSILLKYLLAWERCLQVPLGGTYYLG